MNQEIEILSRELEGKQTKFKALKAIEDLKSIPRALIPVLIKAGVNERDPSANGYFIKPLLKSLPLKEIRDSILNYFTDGSFCEKVGALKLLYHVHKDSQYFDDETQRFITDENVIFENQQEYKERVDILMLKYRNCENPILKFFFKWALPGNEQIREEQPETIDDLWREIKSNKEYSDMLKKIYPEFE